MLVFQLTLLRQSIALSRKDYATNAAAFAAGLLWATGQELEAAAPFEGRDFRIDPVWRWTAQQRRKFNAKAPALC